MRRAWAVSAGLLVLGTMPTSSPASGSDAGARAAVQGVMDRYGAAVKASDARAVASFWSDDAFHMGPGTPTQRGGARAVRGTLPVRPATPRRRQLEDLEGHGHRPARGHALGARFDVAEPGERRAGGRIRRP
jgi:hypothetical protein